MVRKNMDIAITSKKLTSRKKTTFEISLIRCANTGEQSLQNAPGSRRKFVMKYNVMLKTIELVILYGMSVSTDAKASAEGW